ncbi:MAG: YggS family pyridoxal phosphate-dependent enzyme [Phototrophicaceae bacterium]
MNLKERLEHVHDQIALACAKAHRNPNTVTLVGVSKTQPMESLVEAYHAGLRHFGENRMEECQHKVPAVQQALGEVQDLHWHFIGHIQSRKAKEVVAMFPTIHSVDSIKLANKLNEFAKEATHAPQLLIQINISGEASKSGFEAYNWRHDSQRAAQLQAELAQLFAHQNVNYVGLMTMAPFGATEEQLRRIFFDLAEFRQQVEAWCGWSLPHLSMGMTDDYPIAIEAGATMVRVGRAIFGEP